MSPSSPNGSRRRIQDPEVVGSSPTSGTIILHVDEELDHQIIVSMLCQSQGWDLEIARPWEAADVIDRIKPDLILLGVEPKTGLGKLYALRADPRTNHYPLIVLSTDQRSMLVADKLDGVAARMKPFDLPDLVELMTQILLVV